jgi:hypothetical protein
MYTPQEIAKMIGAANTVPQLLVVLYQLQQAGHDVQPDIDRILAKTDLTVFQLDKLWIYARTLQNLSKQKPNNYTNKPV